MRFVRGDVRGHIVSANDKAEIDAAFHEAIARGRASPSDRPFGDLNE
jgi:hypothetical protein